MHEPLPNHLIGDRWQTLRLIARGGMGAVYEARHHLTGERAALKVLFAHVAFDPSAAERFKREVGFAARIGHDGIVRVFDAGADRTTGALYLAMELLEGETLGDRMQRVRDPAGALRVIAGVLEPLAAAHAVGIVHRDLKPQNVFVERTPDGRERARLLDLGIARQMGQGATATASGVMIGSPAYMAPEQVSTARDVTPAADVWAVGVMLYEAIAGVAPFRGETLAAFILAACTQPHVPLVAVAPGTPPVLAALVERCLSKVPGQRPADASRLLVELLPFLDLSHAGTVAVPSEIPPSRAPGQSTAARRARSPLWWTIPIVVILGVPLGVGAAYAAYRWMQERVGGSTMPPPLIDAARPWPIHETAPQPGAVDPPPPRLLGPLTGSLVTSQRPTLRFVRVAEATSTRVELCGDRDCARPIETVETPSDVAVPRAPLPSGVVFWRARSVFGGMAGSVASAPWSFHAPARSAPRGSVVLAFPDLDGDGLADVGVGMPGARSGQGLVRVFAFRSPGGSMQQIDAPPPADATVRLGVSLASAGDVDGDGLSDLLAGSPDSREGAGVSCVSFGASRLLSNRYVSIPGQSHLGATVAGVGDMDADGYADLAIGLRTEQGAVLLLRGSAQGPVAGNTPAITQPGTEELGAAVAFAGDVDADGFADLLVGAPAANQGAGRVYLVHGRPTWSSASDLLVSPYDCHDRGARFGESVAGAGDLDGDGFADALVGAPAHDTVYVLWGSGHGLMADRVVQIVSPAGRGGRFGAALAGVGDIDGDGFGEFAVGAWQTDHARGTVYLYSGAQNGLGAPRAYAGGPEPAGRFGWAIAGAGDVDGDRFLDVVVGAPEAKHGIGRAYVVFGAREGFSARSLLVLQPLEGGSAELGFGTSVF